VRRDPDAGKMKLRPLLRKSDDVPDELQLSTSQRLRKLGPATTLSISSHRLRSSDAMHIWSECRDCVWLQRASCGSERCSHCGTFGLYSSVDATKIGTCQRGPMELDVACALVPRKFTEFGHDLRRSDFCRAASYDLLSEAISSGQKASGTELQSN
jgi:hypothetical protein